MKLDSYLIPYTKIHLKLNEYFSIRSKIVTIQQKITGGNHHDIGLTMISLIGSQKQKQKVDKRDCIKLKNFCSWNIMSRIKYHLRDGKKYLQIIYLISCKYPKCIRKSYNSITKNENKNSQGNLIFKRSNDTIRHLSKEDSQMANSYMKRSSKH